jgi:hypothetical protein
MRAGNRGRSVKLACHKDFFPFVAKILVTAQMRKVADI